MSDTDLHVPVIGNARSVRLVQEFIGIPIIFQPFAMTETRFGSIIHQAEGIGKFNKKLCLTLIIFVGRQLCHKL